MLQLPFFVFLLVNLTIIFSINHLDYEMLQKLRNKIVNMLVFSEESKVLRSSIYCLFVFLKTANYHIWEAETRECSAFLLENWFFNQFSFDGLN